MNRRCILTAYLLLSFIFPGVSICIGEEIHVEIVTPFGSVIDDCCDHEKESGSAPRIEATRTGAKCECVVIPLSCGVLAKEIVQDSWKKYDDASRFFEAYFVFPVFDRVMCPGVRDLINRNTVFHESPLKTVVLMI
ncbi:MAG: hypothetical protein FJ088_10005 [Deltaproteobacteria bacterium]|nr:hypothetical protein [Deltaproteobacteria bacterium]